MHLKLFKKNKETHPINVIISQGEILGRLGLWACEESDTTKRLHFHFSLSCIGEGNGNPLQCSCLENPRDGGAWWASVHGLTRVGHELVTK